MREQINRYGWEFEFDKEITRSYYDKLNGLCSCAMCRNFYANTQSIPIDLRSFLEPFGIDVLKPIEQWSVVADKERNMVDNVVYYVVKGTAKSADRYEIDIGTIQVVVMDPKSDDVVHCPENSPNTEIQEPYFIFEIHNLWLPWIVEDDINECYLERISIGQRVKSLLARIFYKT